MHKNAILNFDDTKKNIYNYIDKNIGDYFDKTGDGWDGFMASLNGSRFAMGYKKNKICGWIQYKKEDKIMIVITAYADKNLLKRKATGVAWKEFVNYSKSQKCESIRMRTRRNHAVMKRLFKFKTIERVMEAKI
tara:strand:- start:6045 stop:6446 length:402 start_codon:yes stop_codon:yes gene_type:complete